MNKQMSLDLFREALDAADAELEAELTAKAAEVIVTREQHEKGVARIMAAFERHRAMKLRRRILISILAAVLVLLTSCTIYVNREKIAAFVEEFYNTYVDVSYGEIDDNAPTEMQTVYQPAYIPEGYELVEAHSNSVRVRTEWVNQDGERIVFAQALVSGNLLSWDNERIEPQILTVNDIAVYYAEYGNTIVYMRNDGEYSFRLTVTENFTFEELEKLIALEATGTE